MHIICIVSMCKDSNRDLCRDWCRESSRDWCRDVIFVTAITRPASLHVGPSDSQAETVEFVFFDCRRGMGGGGVMGGKEGRDEWREWGGARAVVRREVSGEGGGGGEGEGGAF